jgi:hypothetical protein
MRELVADAVSLWAGAAVTDPVTAVPAQPSLTFTLRPVTSSSYSTDALSVSGAIPGVRALAAQPQATSDPSFARDIHTWTVARAAWKRSAESASARASSLAARVSRFRIARRTWSAVYGCVAAAAAQLSPVHGLRLNGDAVLMVEICPARGSVTCTRRFAIARAYLRRRGASAVTVVRADAVTPVTLDDFWRGS